MTSTIVSSSNGTSLAWDAIGRLRETQQGSTTKLLYAGEELIAEYDGAGAILARYVHGAGVDEPLVWYVGAGTGTKRWLAADERGSIASITDAAGAVIQINSYDAYGKPAAGNIGRFQYTGQTWVGEIGLYYYKARFYHPGLGRFLQTDPIGYGDSMNLYAYAGGDPVNARDPSGMAENTTSACGCYGGGLGFVSFGLPPGTTHAEAFRGHFLVSGGFIFMSGLRQGESSGYFVGDNVVVTASQTIAWNRLGNTFSIYRIGADSGDGIYGYPNEGECPVRACASEPSRNPKGPEIVSSGRVLQGNPAFVDFPENSYNFIRVNLYSAGPQFDGDLGVFFPIFPGGSVGLYGGGKFITSEGFFGYGAAYVQFSIGLMVRYTVRIDAASTYDYEVLGGF